jgi:enamine deaminase RidA (YjgF/YER057c/UK114 family)
MRAFHSSLILLALGLAAAPASAQSQPTFSAPPGLFTPPGTSGPHGYSQVVEVPASARLIYTSGQVPLDSAGNLVGAGDFRAQATRVFENLRLVLAASGATFKDVIKLNYYVTDARNLAVLREVRDQFVNSAAPPASTLAEVKGLFRPDVMLEVEAVAAK